MTMSEALRHLGIADHAAGRLEEARRRLEESSGLRREIGFLPGVASNMVGLIYIAAGQGRHDDALALLDQAEAIAQARRSRHHAAGRGSPRAGLTRAGSGRGAGLAR
jgi:tetratricopeptide (TPR) repeat protein